MGHDVPCQWGAVEKTNKTLSRRLGASISFRLAANGDECRPQSSELAMWPAISPVLVVVDSAIAGSGVARCATHAPRPISSRIFNTISGLVLFLSLPHPTPYGYKNIRRDFLATVGFGVVPLLVPSNLLKTFNKIERGTLELWNRIFSYARARMCIHSWFQSSKVPNSYNINKTRN